MSKLKLKADPTFRAKVGIHVPGAESVEVEFTFKHRTRAELKSFIEASAEREDVASIQEMCSGWELADAFTAENIGQLVENYFSAPRAVFQTYLEELTKAREKN